MPHRAQRNLCLLRGAQIAGVNTIKVNFLRLPRMQRTLEKGSRVKLFYRGKTTGMGGKKRRGKRAALVAHRSENGSDHGEAAASNHSKILNTKNALQTVTSNERVSFAKHENCIFYYIASGEKTKVPFS